MCVIGAGAIGSLFAGHLASVADVSILTRRPEHAAALERDGLRISGRSDRVAKVRASAADALAPLVLAMILLSVSVVLTMYLLAIGQRWVVFVLMGGAIVLTLAVLSVHGAPRATAFVDLVVQCGVLLVVVCGFAIVHRVRVTRQVVGVS